MFGVYGMLKTSAGAERVFFLYKAQTRLAPFRAPEGNTIDTVTFCFIFPAEEKATEIQVDGRSNGLPAEK